MRRLNDKEEAIMQILWRQERAFVKEIMDALLPPLPPVTTVSSIVRKLEAEGWLGHESFGKTHRYYPLVSMEDYRAQHVHHLVQDYFAGSPAALLSYFVEKEQADPAELARLLEKLKNQP